MPDMVIYTMSFLSSMSTTGNAIKNYSKSSSKVTMRRILILIFHLKHRQLLLTDLWFIYYYLNSIAFKIWIPGREFFAFIQNGRIARLYRSWRKICGISRRPTSRRCSSNYVLPLVLSPLRPLLPPGYINRFYQHEPRLL